MTAAPAPLLERLAGIPAMGPGRRRLVLLRRQPAAVQPAVVALSLLGACIHQRSWMQWGRHSRGVGPQWGRLWCR